MADLVKAVRRAYVPKRSGRSGGGVDTRAGIERGAVSSSGQDATDPSGTGAGGPVGTGEVGEPDDAT
jgi:hypothetical protein